MNYKKKNVIKWFAQEVDQKNSIGKTLFLFLNAKSKPIAHVLTFNVPLLRTV